MNNFIGSCGMLAAFVGIAFLTMDLYIPMAVCMAITAGAAILERRING